MEKKEIKMKPVVGAQEGTHESTQPEKMNYTQVVDIANQLQSQNRELMMRLQNLSNVYHRLDYLFKVVENAAQFEEEFAKACAAEIQDIITIPAEKTTEEEPKKD